MEELDFLPGSWLCRCRSVVYDAPQGEPRPLCTNYWRGTVCGLVRASGDTGWVPRSPTPPPASREEPVPKAASAAPAAPASPAVHTGDRVVDEVNSELDAKVQEGRKRTCAARQAELERAAQAGGWTCLRDGCGVSNVASRDKCFKCCLPRGQRAGAVRVRAHTPSGPVSAAAAPPSIHCCCYCTTTITLATTTRIPQARVPWAGGWAGGWGCFCFRLVPDLCFTFYLAPLRPTRGRRIFVEIVLKEKN